MITYTFTAGRLLCGQIRRELEAAKYRGDIEDFFESSGWLDRKFVIKFDKPETVESITSWLEKMAGER